MKIIQICLISLIYLINPISPIPVHAEGLDAAGTFAINDPGATSGDIIVSTQNGFKRATIPYDNNIFGVLADNSVVVLQSGEAGARPVARTGVATVNVVMANGAIAAGDYLTSSQTPGKAQKATQSGYVLGIALASADKDGQVPVALRIEYAELTTARNANRLLEYLGASFFSNVKNPEQFGMIVRYILAAVVLLISFGFGFITFSRSLPKAVEAIGRNPLARHTIYLSMALNVGMIAVVGIIGIAGALLILRF
ncbi:MAG: hypothetical protein M1484_04345 [Patescibacteria group bacterium]|nr:hypothetical protein [Patescibacteria group bacterium]MCL5432290.1 hypothetical protein [Patescibacteria group bacterium]